MRPVEAGQVHLFIDYALILNQYLVLFITAL